MKIVIAIGGNSIINGENSVSSTSEQYNQITETCRNLVKILNNNDEIVITHGNGPQVGYLLRMSEKAKDEIPLFPLDYCVANTQGAIGYHLQMALNKVMQEEGIKKEAVTIITQVVVSRDDPAFENPTKPIGAFFTEEEIIKHAKMYGWKYINDSGCGYRRVVPSPKPISIIEINCIRTLIDNNFVVIACGGGGIPVVKKNGEYVGCEAVIDKDAASALLAISLNADLFIISTAVDHAYINYKKEGEEMIKEIKVSKLREYLDKGHFEKGSMEPKIKACIKFTESTGKRSVITSPSNIYNSVKGMGGTQIIL